MERHPGGSPLTRPRALAAMAPCIAIATLLLAVGVANAAPPQAAPEWAVQARLAGRSLLLDAAAVDGALLAVGERGHILVSGDEGEIWQQAEVPVQSFVVRSDLACGSTIGPLTASTVGVRTLDVGVATFAMHSIREMGGARDTEYLYEALKAFFTYSSR